MQSADAVPVATGENTYNVTVNVSFADRSIELYWYCDFPEIDSVHVTLYVYLNVDTLAFPTVYTIEPISA